MPRKGARKTLVAAGGNAQGASFKVESAAAAASVDVLDTDLTTNFGVVADELTVAEFQSDYVLARTPIATSGDEAADTIGLARVDRNAGDDGFEVFFTAAAAATKKVGVRVTAL